MLAVPATAILVALGMVSPGAVQASDLGVSGLSSGPASSVAPNGLEGIGGATSGSPKAEVVAGKVYDFGSVLNAVPVAHVFKIHNAGTGTLVIGGVQTSCGCTAAKPTKSQLPPGEDSDIAVTFDTRYDKGPATRTITVYTNDPAAKSIVLTIKGDVKVQVEAAPAQVAFGDVKHGTDQTRQVLLNDLVAGTDPAKAPQEFKVQSITNASSNIKVAEAPRTDGKAGGVLTVTLLPTMPIGAFDDTIKVTTSRAPVDITVFGNVQGDITVKPVQVSFGIPERQLALLKQHLAQNTLRVEAQPQGDLDKPAVGRIAFVDNAVDQTTGTIKIKGTFPNLDRRLWPGQFVNVIVRLGTDVGATVVPSIAVQTGPEGQYVFVVTRERTVEMRTITIVRTAGAETVIKGGVKPGETVVTDGQLRLVPGSRINIKEARAPEVAS